MEENDEQWRKMVADLRQGKSQVVGDFWRQYGPLMHRLAEAHLSPKLKRRVGAEDVVQSVCRTFFRRARGGEFTLSDSHALWRLLCAITLTKVRQQARHHGRAKRGMGREVPMQSSGDEDSELSRFGQAAGPTPEQEAIFSEQFQQLIEHLDDEQRQLVLLKLDDLTNDQVAARLGCSERTVRRLLKEVQEKLDGLL